MSNAYPGTCRDCEEHVPKGGGTFHRKERGYWTLRCTRCIRACNDARAIAGGSYEEWRAYWRRARGLK